MIALITGGSGFIGGEIARYLADRNIETVIPARENILQKETDNIIYRYGNLNDSGFIEELFKEYQPSAVIHAAWDGITKDYRNDPGQADNFSLTKSLLEICSRYSIKSFIGIGSQEEFGIYNKRIDETFLPKPVSLYGLYKLSAGLLGKVYAAEAGFNYAWLRLFSTFGPGDQGSYLIPDTIRKLLDHEQPALTACEQMWDYLYVKDIPLLIEKILQQNKHYNDIYNLCSGRPIQLKTVINKIYQLTSTNADPGFGSMAYRKDGLIHLEGNPGKFKDTFGWTDLTSIEEGLTETVKWWQDEYSHTYANR